MNKTKKNKALSIQLQAYRYIIKEKNNSVDWPKRWRHKVGFIQQTVPTEKQIKGRYTFKTSKGREEVKAPTLHNTDTQTKTSAELPFVLYILGLMRK